MRVIATLMIAGAIALMGTLMIRAASDMQPDNDRESIGNGISVTVDKVRGVACYKSERAETLSCVRIHEGL